MTKEFNLSEKRFLLEDSITVHDSEGFDVIKVKDVKEFIKKVKEAISHDIEMAVQSGYIDDELWYPPKDLIASIDKFAGDELLK